MTESDLDELEMLHASLPGMNLPPDALHGLLTALVMAGDTVPVEAHVADLLGCIPPDPSVSSASSASSATPCPVPDEALSRRFAHLLALMRADVEAALDDPDYLFAPMVRMYPHDDGGELADGRVWGAGFLLGMNRCRDVWAELLRVPEIEQGLWSVYRLGECCKELQVQLDPLLQRGALERPMSREQCDALTEHLPHVLEAVWIQIAAHQADTAMQAMQRGEEAQAWRDNPPCPCGSGKGFLDCCGNGRVLH